MTRDRRRFLRLSGLALAGALAGCTSQYAQQNSAGDNGTISGGANGSATTTVGERKTTGSGGQTTTTAKTDSGATTVDATLVSYDIELSKTTIPSGEVSFDVRNNADQNHEFVVFATDLAEDDLPTVNNGQKVDEDASSVTSIHEIEDVAPGTSQTLTLDLDPGSYVVICNLPGHYKLGMHAGLTVQQSGSETQTETSQTGGTQAAYDWIDATFDSYWYSLYNMSTNISMSANGVLFPHNKTQKKAFEKRLPAMLKAAKRKKPPVKNPNLNMAPFTTGDPHFTQKPVLKGPDGRPDASTLEWNGSKSSKVVSPSSLAWTHLKGVTWAKNFQEHADILPESLAPLFRAEVLTTLGQLGTKFALVDGHLRANDQNLKLVSGFRPGDGTVTDGTARPHHHSAMLWFLSDLVSLATGGWFGYENPKPLIPAENIQMLADGMAKTTMKAFPPEKIVDAESTRELGEMLGAVGWYGTHAGTGMSADNGNVNSGDSSANGGNGKAKRGAGEMVNPRPQAVNYANALAATVEDNLDGNGMVTNGGDNQAATQGVVGQGLAWASQIEGVDHRDMATDVLGYLTDTLWDDDAGTYASGEGASTYTITARDAGDIVGGVNAADAVLGMSGVEDQYAQFFDATFNHGPLQRAQRPSSVDEHTKNEVPLPPKAGGEFGQAAVYNAEVEYDTKSGNWSVTDDTFNTEQALYLANQDIWISHWGGQFFDGRGVPGKSDAPPS